MDAVTDVRDVEVVRVDDDSDKTAAFAAALRAHDSAIASAAKADAKATMAAHALGIEGASYDNSGGALGRIAVLEHRGDTLDKTLDAIDRKIDGVVRELAASRLVRIVHVFAMLAVGGAAAMWLIDRFATGAG